MRKVRDYDAEIKVLSDKARALKSKKIEQFGSLVMATGADVLDAETIAGILLDALAIEDMDAKEAWRAKGEAFFQRSRRKGGGAAIRDRSATDKDAAGDAAR